jgi:hypothetical protein
MIIVSVLTTKFQSFNHFGDVAPSRPSNDPKNAIKSFGNTNPGMYAVKIPKPQLDTFCSKGTCCLKQICPSYHYKNKI